jgi:hypothetical protein
VDRLAPLSSVSPRDAGQKSALVDRETDDCDGRQRQARPAAADQHKNAAYEGDKRQECAYREGQRHWCRVPFRPARLLWRAVPPQGSPRRVAPAFRRADASLDDSAILQRQERPELRQAVTLDPEPSTVLIALIAVGGTALRAWLNQCGTRRTAEFTLSGQMAARVKDYRDELSRFKLWCRWPPSSGSRLRCC